MEFIEGIDLRPANREKLVNAMLSDEVQARTMDDLREIAFDPEGVKELLQAATLPTASKSRVRNALKALIGVCVCT